MKTFVLAVPNANLFPFTIKPISIQSIPQAQLIRQSIADQVPMAIGFYMSGESHYRSIAGYGYPYIAESRLDGSILIYVQGDGKVNLNNSTAISNGIITYNDVQLITETYELDESLNENYLALSKYFAYWIDRHMTDPVQKDFFIKSLVGAKEIIAACSAYLVKDFEMQYELMEKVDINEQIAYLHRLMLSSQLLF